MIIQNPVFLQKAIELCKRVEEKNIQAFPYICPETDYIISILNSKEYCFIPFSDCKINNQPDWLAYHPNDTELYLKNKNTNTIYYISN